MSSSVHTMAETVRHMTGNLAAGLGVLSGELLWLVRGSIHAHEIRQIQRRQDQELKVLGSACEHALSAENDPEQQGLSDKTASPEMDLAARQVRFLRDEIDRLKENAMADRARFIEKQRLKYEKRHPADNGSVPQANQ